MITLNPLTEASLKISAEQHNTLQWSDKSLFEYILKDYKAVEKKSRGKVTDLLNKAINQSSESTNVQNALKKVARLAKDYAELQVIAKFDNLEYTTIHKLVMLFKYVDKHDDSKSGELREQVKEVYSKDMSIHRYNTVLLQLVTKLRERYGKEDIDGNIVPFGTIFSQVKSNSANWTAEQRAELVAYLTQGVA